MERFKATLIASFRTKVLVPVVGTMVLLMAVSMWLVNRRVTKQLQDDAMQMLVTADAVLRNSQDYRAKQFVLRYRNIVNEPRFKAVSGTKDGNTMQGFMDELLQEKAADVMMVVAADSGARLAGATADPLLNLDQFQAGCASTISQAKQGRTSVDTVQFGQQLFDIVSLPLRVGKEIVGVMTFGQQNSVAQDFKGWTQSELVLFSDRQLVSSTITQPDSYPLLAEKVAQLSDVQPKPGFNPIEQITLNNEHYLCRVGSLGDPNSAHQLRYLVFSSYERPLQVLHATKQMILWVGLLAILLGAAVVWLLVRKVTQPLSELCDSAEAVGRGDFSRRVEVRTQDECGELAHVFNRMVESVKQSRDELEATVERLKTTQAQLIQSEKLSGVGEFVAGVAHELNNPLTAVMGFSELLQQAPTAPNQRSFVESIHKNAKRCQKIVQSLLGFARRHQPERKPVCINSLVESSLDILRYQLRTGNITVTTRLDPDLPLAMVDSHQIQQVFVNILNNARQAIESQQPKGWIKIITETRWPSVRITIQDSGPGIAPENLPRIFDPFFTTKEVGKGTGLGLSLCYGIIKEHGGSITPINQTGEGATFVIDLPITHATGDTTNVLTRAEAEPPASDEGAGKRVLIIDDEEQILHMLREVLRMHGYEVDVASDGESGLNRLRQTKYDLALCDWKMPGLNGRQVYERLQEMDPAMTRRVVFITGDLINEKTRRFLEEEQRPCIPKPFTLDEFRSVINKTLAAAA